MNKAVAKIRELSNAVEKFAAKTDADKWALREALEIRVQIHAQQQHQIGPVAHFRQRRER